MAPTSVHRTPRQKDPDRRVDPLSPGRHLHLPPDTGVDKSRLSNATTTSGPTEVKRREMPLGGGPDGDLCPSVVREVRLKGSPSDAWRPCSPTQGSRDSSTVRI